MNCCEKLLTAAQKISPCECSGAGWCERHKMQKVPHFAMLCRTNIQYFEQYENGIGPGQNVSPIAPQPHIIGLGDVVAWAIRVTTLGRVKPWPGCGCQARKAWLNKIQLWPIRWPWRRHAP